MNEIFTRRSVRKYLSRAVEREKLDEILRAGNYAPSALNNQDRQFTVVSRPEVLERINQAVRNLSDKATVERVSARMNGEFAFFYKAPVLILVSHKANARCPEADCACALENMFLEAKALSLGSCWINQLGPLCDQAEIREILNEIGVPSDHRIFGCAAIGYPAEEGVLLHEKESKIVFCQ